jgi:hypothetical protein
MPDNRHDIGAEKPSQVMAIIPTRVTWPRRLCALLLDAVIIAVLTLVLTVVTVIGYMGVTGDDFDGPPSYEPTGNWFMLSLLGCFALLLSTSEIWFSASPGKAILVIRIEGDGRWRSLILRWLVKWLPLIVFAAIACTGFCYMQINRGDFYMQYTRTFHEQMLWLVTRLPPMIATIVVIATLLRLKPLHDWLAGTQLVRRSRKSPRQGFTPIMTGGSRCDATQIANVES